MPGSTGLLGAGYTAVGTTNSTAQNDYHYGLAPQALVALRLILGRRDAFYPDVGDSSQSRGTIGLFYVYLGHDRFGAVEWR